MTKAEQARRMAWRFKVMQQAASDRETSRARAGILAFLGRPFIGGSGGLTPMAPAGLSDRPSTPAPVAQRHAARGH